MGQPNPPGDMPLIEGLDPSWNEFVSAFPEDKRAELAPKLKERITGIENQYAPLKDYEDFHKSGINRDQIETALHLFSTIEHNPKQVYEVLGKHLGISQQEAKEVVEQIEDGEESEDPRIAALQNQVQTLMQVQLAKHQQEVQSKEAAEADAQLEKELTELKKKHGDSEVNEEEIIMRMLHKGMTAEDAYNDYAKMVTTLRTTRPAPMLMGSGGAIPSRAVDPTKLDNAGTKNLVAQMMANALQERKQ